METISYKISFIVEESKQKLSRKQFLPETLIILGLNDKLSIN